jgi:cellulose synthase/poly-beta-1,6-N-acetylglucosamine synthase-like glycosyltransferase
MATLLLVLFIISLLIILITYLGYPLIQIFRTRIKKDNSSPKNFRKQETTSPYISIVIPTYNEERVIQRKLENTVNLCNTRNMEIIVVDDGSTDHTLDIAERYNQTLNSKIRIITSKKNKGKPTALNKACKAARGGIIVVTDADVFLSKDSITMLLSNFSNQNVGAVCGRETIANPNTNFVTRLESKYRNLFHFSRVIEKSSDFPPIPFHGGLMAFRKELYPELPSDTIGDDHEIALKIWRMGYNVIYDSRATFAEYATQSLREIYEQKRRRAQGIVQSILLNKDLLFNKKNGRSGKSRFPLLLSQFFISPFIFFIGGTSLVLYIFLVTEPTVWILLSSILLISIVLSSVICSFSKKWYWGIPLAFFGLLFFQIAIVHAILDTLLGNSNVHWKKIDGQRIDPKHGI